MQQSENGRRVSCDEQINHCRSVLRITLAFTMLPGAKQRLKTFSGTRWNCWRVSLKLIQYCGGQFPLSSVLFMSLKRRLLCRGFLCRLWKELHALGILPFCMTYWILRCPQTSPCMYGIRPRNIEGHKACSAGTLDRLLSQDHSSPAE